jgi:hypothetical protein
MTLPDDYLVRRVREHWAVVGPTGLFVVGRCEGDPAVCARLTAAVAHEMRTRLSEVVPWVPFVDPVVIAEQEHPDLDCAVIELDRLQSVLTEGPVVVDDYGLGQLRHHLPGVAQAMDLERLTYPG